MKFKLMTIYKPEENINDQYVDKHVYKYVIQQ